MAYQKMFYIEQHHICPRCLGGTGDTKENRFKKYSKHPNCIWLTAKEHFIAHKLLAKEYPDNAKIQYAFYMMCCMHESKCSYNDRHFEILAEEYELGKLAFKRAIELDLEHFLPKTTRKNRICNDKTRSIKHFNTKEEAESFIKEHPDWRFGGLRHTEDFKKKMHEQFLGSGNKMFGKKHSEAFKKAQSERYLDTIFITNGKIDYRIKKNELIPTGFWRGRSNMSTKFKSGKDNFMFGKHENGKNIPIIVVETGQEYKSIRHFAKDNNLPYGLCMFRYKKNRGIILKDREIHLKKS